MEVTNRRNETAWLLEFGMVKDTPRLSATIEYVELVTVSVVYNNYEPLKLVPNA